MVASEEQTWENLLQIEENGNTIFIWHFQFRQRKKNLLRVVRGQNTK